MRVTGLGMPGCSWRPRSGSILCDPWFNPAFFGSWFPFPDNDGLDRAGSASPTTSTSRISTTTTSTRRCSSRARPQDAHGAAPGVPDRGHSRPMLRDLGFTSFLQTRAGEASSTCDGLRMMITRPDAPGDGPIGDSALSLDDAPLLLNQNDSHPLDFDEIRAFGPFDASLHPVLRGDLVPDGLRPARSKKRRSPAKRAPERPDAVLHRRGRRRTSSRWRGRRLPRRGAVPLQRPRHRRPAIFRTSAISCELAIEAPDTAAISRAGNRRSTLDCGSCTVTQTFRRRRDRPDFGDKCAYLRGLPASTGHEAAAAEARPGTRRGIDLFEQLNVWWEPLMKRRAVPPGGIGGSVLFHVGDSTC